MKIINRIVSTDRTPIWFGNEVLASVDPLLTSLHPSGIFILVDSNTKQHCLHLLLDKSTLAHQAHVIETEAGETAKSLENAEKIWNELMASGADRSSVLINLGGGVVSDLGGFVAAGFQRGINYINIPTSLMGQADAAIGGKTAVNLGNIKNQIGFFHPAKAVFIFPGFLKTLPTDHLRSGLAEIIKSILISDAILWRRLIKQPVSELLKLPVESGIWFTLISAAVKYKNKVVMSDFRERKHRKVLNFGHTIGHAFEGHSQQLSYKPLLHGEAVAAGMITASYLSVSKAGLLPSDMEAIVAYLDEGFPRYRLDPVEIPSVMKIMSHDKKRQQGHAQFTLLSKPGCSIINVACEEEEILEAIKYYHATTHDFLHDI
jgi:3-dehydroquinate synthase